MRFSDKIFIIPIILLGLNFIYRLIDFAKIITTFPLDYVNDISAYIALSHFFVKYGYLELVPNWYNGFILFNTYPPGYSFFMYPLILLTSNILLSTFLSAIILYILGFIAIYFIGKELDLTIIKRTALYLFVYANPMIIGGMLKQGRITSLMALVIFSFIVYLVIYFKSRPITNKIYFLSLLLALLVLTHHPETILAGIFLIGFILIKENKEKIKIIASIIIGIILSAFWWIPFLKYSIINGVLELNFGNWLLNFKDYFWNNFIGIILSLTLFVIFYFYYRPQQDKAILYLYLPVLILNFLFLTRVVIFIPIIKHIYPDPYQDFFMFFASLFLVSINFNKLTNKIKNILLILLIIGAIASVTYNITKTPFFQDYTQQEEDFIYLVPKIEGKFLMFTESPKTSYSRAYYCYAAIFYNKETPSGWEDYAKEPEFVWGLKNTTKEYMKTEDCKYLMKLNQEYMVEQILTEKHYCQIMTQECGLELVETKGEACLLNF
jgi:hypothetical protein